MLNLHRIHIPFSQTNGIGGPSTFMLNLKRFLKRTGYRYSCCLETARAIFFPVAYQHKPLQELKVSGGKIIQRLDGVFYPSKHGDDYQKLNFPFQRIYYDYADVIVFQSDYSKLQCFTMFGPIPEERCHTILNGVDTEIFFPNFQQVYHRGEKLRLVTTGVFRHLEQLEPIVHAIEGSLENSIQLTVVGPISNQKISAFVDRDYIELTGPKRIEDVARILRSSHGFVYSILNPSCPNSILEAVATGIPVISFATGALPELCNFNSALLASVSGEVFQSYQDFDSEGLREKVECLINSYSHYREIALANWKRYAFDSCGEKYRRLFDETLSTIKRWHPVGHFRPTVRLKRGARKMMRTVLGKVLFHLMRFKRGE